MCQYEGLVTSKLKLEEPSSTSKDSGSSSRASTSHSGNSSCLASSGSPHCSALEVALEVSSTSPSLRYPRILSHWPLIAVRASQNLILWIDLWFLHLINPINVCLVTQCSSKNHLYSWSNKTLKSAHNEGLLNPAATEFVLPCIMSSPDKSAVSNSVIKHGKNGDLEQEADSIPDKGKVVSHLSAQQHFCF